MGIGRRLLVVVAVSLGVMLPGPAPASAHNALTGSDPADGETMAQGPAEVGLSFLSTLDPDGAEVSVTGPDGSSATAGDAEFDGSGLTIPVDTPLAGDYSVTYQVRSSDGHQVDGSIEFTVTEGAEPSPAPATSPTPAAGPPGQSPSPASAAPAAAATAAAGGAGSGGVPWWVWPLAALVLAAGGYGAYRRTRRAPAG